MKKGKPKANNRRQSKHLLLYDLAQLCEEQIKSLDSLYTVGDADKHSSLQSDIECLRASYQLQRSYYIAKVYFYNNEYNAASAIFESIANDCRTFSDSFDWSKTEISESELDIVMNLSCLIGIGRHKNLIASMGSDCQRMRVLSLANSVLKEDKNQRYTQQKMQQMKISPDDNQTSVLSHPLISPNQICSISFSHVQNMGISCFKNLLLYVIFRTLVTALKMLQDLRMSF